MDVEEFVNSHVQRFVETAAAAEVLAVGFRLVPQRLLVDMRYSEVDPPMIKVVQRVSSVEERLRDLQKVRSRFPAPKQFHFVMWPRSVAAFRDFGPWSRIMDRLYASGHPGIVEDARVALDVLLSLEREETIQAVRGVNYRNLWPLSK